MLAQLRSLASRVYSNHSWSSGGKKAIHGASSKGRRSVKAELSPKDKERPAQRDFAHCFCPLPYVFINRGEAGSNRASAPVV